MRIARVALAAAALAAAIPALGASSALADSNLTASPTSAFPDTPLQTLGAAQTITFTNTSIYDFMGGSGSLAGTATDDYFVTGNTCGATIPAGASCTVRVRFSPSFTGPREADLTVRGSLWSNGPLTSHGNAQSTVTLTGTGAALPGGPQGPAGITGANGNDGATGPQGNTGATGPKGKNGANGKNGKNGRSAAATLAKRSACKVTRLHRGSRVACTFTKAVSKRAVLTLRDRRGAVAGARGTGTRQMTFVTARPVLGKLSFRVIVGSEAVIPVERS